MKRKRIFFNLTVKQKKKLTIGTCVCVVLLFMGLSFFGKGMEKVENGLQEKLIISASGKQDNAVALNLGSTYENSDESFSVAVNDEENRVVDNSFSQHEERRNAIVADSIPEPVVLASSVLEDHGVKAENTKEHFVLYQYPVGIGKDEQQNYDGKQKQTDVIRKMTRVTELEEEQPSEDLSSGCVVSGGATFVGEDGSVSGSAGVITGGAVVPVTDSDPICPSASVLGDSLRVIGGGDEKITFTNQNHVPIRLAESTTLVDKYVYAYGDKLSYIPEPQSELQMVLPMNFFGEVLFYCVDENGVSSESTQENILVDTNAPKICFTNSEVSTAPYRMQIDVVDTGHIVSGIDKITCMINGEPYDIGDLKAKEYVRLNDGVQVSSKMEFSLLFDEVGMYDISLEVMDNAGNITHERTKLEVSKPELVAVYMPKNFTIHIDPQQLRGREQIFSDDIILKNVSGFDVKVNISEINVIVSSEVSSGELHKDCSIYLINPDSGEKLSLNKGKNKNMLSYRLPAEESGDIANLKFVGDISGGSESMWRDSDIRIDVKLTFEKW